MSEIIFKVREDEVDGGYNAMALGYGVHTQGETLRNSGQLGIGSPYVKRSQLKGQPASPNCARMFVTLERFGLSC